MPLCPAAAVKGGIGSGVAEGGGVLAAAFVLMVSVRRNTTLGFVAMSTLLSNAQLSQLAPASTAAMHHWITPCGTPFDRDYSLPPRHWAQS